MKHSFNWNIQNFLSKVLVHVHNVKWIMMLYCTNREHSKIIVFMYFYNIEWMLINDNSASTDLLAADLKFFVKLIHLLFTPFFNENMIIFYREYDFGFHLVLTRGRKNTQWQRCEKLKTIKHRMKCFFEWLGACIWPL